MPVASGEYRTLKKYSQCKIKYADIFSGGGKCASNVALRGDMGWNSCFVKAKTEVFRLWIKPRTIPNKRMHNVCITGQNAMRVAGKEEGQNHQIS